LALPARRTAITLEVTMPWFPDFVGAAELARRDSQVAGRADPVAQYLQALQQGNAKLLEKVWPGQVTVFDPLAGEIRGHSDLRHFVNRNRVWLAERQARTETVASTRAGRRAVVEVLATLQEDGRSVSWPIAVVADSADEHSVTFRTYCSTLPHGGQRHLRAPILESGLACPKDIVGRYGAALGAGRADEIVKTFLSDGYFRGPIGPDAIHRGTDELRAFYLDCFSTGGVTLELCAVTDDGQRCALEYNCVRWGSLDLPPQAGIAIFERGTSGLLAAVRVYDDVVRPSTPSNS
jgi:hypothetical protein